MCSHVGNILNKNQTRLNNYKTGVLMLTLGNKYSCYNNNSKLPVYSHCLCACVQAKEDEAKLFLQTMGLKVATEVRDAPINFSSQEAKHYSEIFKEFDKDKNGHISIHDLRKAIQEIGEEVSDNKLRDLIAEVDINKNCTIEEEFL